MPLTPDFYIRKFKLTAHPEGGLFRELYRSTLQIHSDALPEVYGSNRSVSTAILFLLKDGDFSAFHKINSDELWHFHAGKGAFIYCIQHDGSLAKHRLSADPNPDSVFQVIIPKDTWFAAELIDPQDFLLTGCTVAPGFDFSDFTLADRDTLIAEFPKHSSLIKRLTRIHEK